MATPAQIAANQSNAQHSTGPRTAEGKARAAQNNLNLGFRSATVLLPTDDPAVYEALLQELTGHFSPSDLTEDRFVREMTDAEWRLRRVRTSMAAAIARQMEKLAAAEPGLNAVDLESRAIETLAKPAVPTPPGSATKPNSNASTTAPTPAGPAIRTPNAASPPKKPTSPSNKPSACHSRPRRQPRTLLSCAKPD